MTANSSPVSEKWGDWGVRYPQSKKWGVRVPLVRYAYVAGSLMSASGFVISAFTPNVPILYFSYGVLAGIMDRNYILRDCDCPLQSIWAYNSSTKID